MLLSDGIVLKKAMPSFLSYFTGGDGFGMAVYMDRGSCLLAMVVYANKLFVIGGVFLYAYAMRKNM